MGQIINESEILCRVRFKELLHALEQCEKHCKIKT